MDIRNALERKGFDIKRILEYANRMRHLYSDEVVRKEEKLTDDIKISFSCQLAEKPINLVIQKKFLKGLAQGIYLISSDGYAIVRGKKVENHIGYDKTDPLSIEAYAQRLIGKTFRQVIEDDDEQFFQTLREESEYGVSEVSETKRNKGI